MEEDIISIRRPTKLPRNAENAASSAGINAVPVRSRISQAEFEDIKAAALLCGDISVSMFMRLCAREAAATILERHRGARYV